MKTVHLRLAATDRRPLPPAFGLAFCLLAACPALAAESYAIGIGTRTCASWLSSRANSFEGTVWIFGFWSGLNAYNLRGRNFVGQSSSAEARISEVRKMCLKDPSSLLAYAAAQAYEAMEQREGDSAKKNNGRE